MRWFRRTPLATTCVFPSDLATTCQLGSNTDCALSENKAPFASLRSTLSLLMGHGQPFVRTAFLNASWMQSAPLVRSFFTSGMASIMSASYFIFLVLFTHG